MGTVLIVPGALCVVVKGGEGRQDDLLLLGLGGGAGRGKESEAANQPLLMSSKQGKKCLHASLH